MKEKTKNNLKKIKLFVISSAHATAKYVFSKLITSLIITIVSFAVFKILGIRLSFLLAVILGVTNTVPVIGSWAGMIICSVIGLFQQPIFAIYILATAMFLQVLEQFLLSPLILGKSLKLKPFWIIIAVLAGGIIAGFWGIILAVPVSASIKIAYDLFIRKSD